MSPESHPLHRSSRTRRTMNAVRAMPYAEDGLGCFDLKDTLKGISVRDTSFGEFLAALKHYGQRTSKA